MDYQGLGKRIKMYREKMDMTQQTLGERIDYSTQHISHIETGTTKLSVECFFDIADALQVSLDELACSNVETSVYVLEQELAELLADCTPKEKRILIESVKALKEILKKNDLEGGV